MAANATARVWLVRHGRAAAGWDSDPDPGLDDLGRGQALAVARALTPLRLGSVVTSPLLRCRQTAFPLAAAWGVEARVEPAVAEIPSPPEHTMQSRVGWLREAMAGTWTDLAERSGAAYSDFRDRLVAAIGSLTDDTVVFTHFVAINALIGAATGDDRVLIASLDNCSVTTVDVDPAGAITVHGIGREADTLIR